MTVDPGEHGPAMTIAHASMVHLRLTAMILSSLVQRGVLRPKEAAALVRETMTLFRDDQYDAKTVGTLREAYESIAQQMEEMSFGRPL